MRSEITAASNINPVSQYRQRSRPSATPLFEVRSVKEDGQIPPSAAYISPIWYDDYGEWQP
jgi:hypothetical protein